MATPFILTARIQTALDTGSLTRTTALLRKTLSGRPISLRVIVDDAKLKKLASTLGTVDASARRAQAGMTGFAHSVKLAATRFMAFTLAASVMIKLTMALREGFKQAAQFDREMVRLTQVTNKSMRGLQPLVQQITHLSESLGVSSLKMVEMSRILAQTGMSAKDTAIALKAIAKTELAPTFTDIKRTAEGAIAAMRQFNIEAKDLEATLGAINAVSKRFAVESDDIITAIRRTGGVFQAAGGQINELIAIFTSVRSTTRETAETIATGLRTIFTRIQRPKTIKFLRQFGIELTDLQGKFVGPMEAIRRLSVSLRGMETTDLQFGRIIEQLGGFRQVGKVIPMIVKHETAVKALAVAQGGANSLTIDAAKAQKALLVQVARVKEEFHDMMRKMLASEGFKSMISMTLNLASAMIKLVESLEPVLPMLMALSAIKLGGMAMGGMRGMRAGGMARGGVVPGSGNYDTVPAMLTPGEFVIKKSSAKKLGYDNLSGMNKHAKGGRIHATGQFGGMFIDPHLMEDQPARGIVYGGTLRGAPALANKINAGAIHKQGKGRATQVGAALGAKQRLEFPGGGQEQMLRSLSRHNPGAYAALLANRRPPLSGKSLAQVAKAAPLTNMSGGHLANLGFKKKQIALSMQRAGLFTGGGKTGTLAARSKAKNQEGQVTPADITGGIVQMSGDPFLFGVSSVTRDDFAKVYKRNSDQMLQDFARSPMSPTLLANIKERAGGKSVEGHMFEAYLLARSGQGAISTDSSEDFDFRKGMITPELASLFGKPGGTGGIQGFAALDAKRTKDASSMSSLVKKAMNTFASTGRGSGLNLQFTPHPGDFGKKTGSTPFMLAAGGPVGSDTVPALLTPGEFVINKKSASRIGLGALSSMNRYAAGGVVTSDRHNYGRFGPSAPPAPSSRIVPPDGGGGGGGSMMMMMMLPMLMSMIPQMAQLGGASEESAKQIQDFTGIMMGATMALMMFQSKLSTAGGAATAAGLMATAAVYAWGLAMEKAAARAKEAAIKRGARETAMLKAEEEARHGMGKDWAAIGGVIGTVVAAIALAFTSLALLPVALIAAAVGAVAALVAYMMGFDFGADDAAEAARKEVAARMDAIDATNKFSEGMNQAQKDIKAGNLDAATAGFVAEIKALQQAIDDTIAGGTSLDSEEFTTMTERLSESAAATATHLSRLAVEGAKQGKTIGRVIQDERELIKAHGTAKAAALTLAAAQVKAAAATLPPGAAGSAERKARDDEFSRAADMRVKAAMIRHDAEKEMEAAMAADHAQQLRHTEALKASAALFLHQAMIVQDLGSVMKALSIAAMEAADNMREIGTAASLGMGKVGATKLKGRGEMLSGKFADADQAQYATLTQKVLAPLGQMGQEISAELVGSQKAFSELPEFLISKVDLQTGGMQAGWQDDLKIFLDDARFAGLPDQVKDQIKRSVAEMAGDGPVTPQKLQDLLAESEGLLEPVKKKIADMYKMQLEHVNRLNSAYDKQRKLLGAMAKSQMDWVRHGFKAMSVMRKHMGMESSLANSQMQFAAEQQAILGQAGLGALGGNIAGMGGALRGTNKQILAWENRLAASIGDPTQAGLAADKLAQLKNQSEALTKALGHATNRAGERATVEEKIGKAKSEREDRKGLLEEFTFGTKKEKGKLAKDLRITQFAAAVGDMDRIPDKLKGTVLKTLDRFKDTMIPGAGGRTGQEVKNQLMARQAQKMGASPQQIQRVLMRGREEEMLINYLGHLFTMESQARMELMAAQRDMHVVLTNDIQELHIDFINRLTQVLQQIQGGNPPGAMGVLGQQWPGGAQPRPQGPPGPGGQMVVPLLGGQGGAPGAPVQGAGPRAARPRQWGPRADGANNRQVTIAQNTAAANAAAAAATAAAAVATAAAEAARRAHEQQVRAERAADELERKRKQREADALARERERQRISNTIPGGTTLIPHPRAAGGIIYAKGGFQAQGTDTVPAMLTPGEFVVRKSSAQKIGYGNLKSMNALADGGVVGGRDRSDGSKYVPHTPRLTGMRTGDQPLNEKQRKARRKMYLFQNPGAKTTPFDFLLPQNTGAPSKQNLITGSPPKEISGKELEKKQAALEKMLAGHKKPSIKKDFDIALDNLRMIREAEAQGVDPDFMTRGEGKGAGSLKKDMLKAIDQLMMPAIFKDYDSNRKRNVDRQDPDYGLKTITDPEAVQRDHRKAIDLQQRRQHWGAGGIVSYLKKGGPAEGKKKKSWWERLLGFMAVSHMGDNMQLDDLKDLMSEDEIPAERRGLRPPSRKDRPHMASIAPQKKPPKKTPARAPSAMGAIDEMRAASPQRGAIADRQRGGLSLPLDIDPRIVKAKSEQEKWLADMRADVKSKNPISNYDPAMKKKKADLAKMAEMLKIKKEEAFKPPGMMSLLDQRSAEGAAKDKARADKLRYEAAAPLRAADARGKASLAKAKAEGQAEGSRLALAEPGVQEAHTAKLRERLNKPVGEPGGGTMPGMAPLGEDVGRRSDGKPPGLFSVTPPPFSSAGSPAAWRPKGDKWSRLRKKSEKFRGGSAGQPPSRLRRKSERFRGSADRRRAAAKVKQDAWLAKRKKEAATPEGKKKAAADSAQKKKLQAKWAKDSAAFKAREEQRARVRGGGGRGSFTGNSWENYLFNVDDGRQQKRRGQFQRRQGSRGGRRLNRRMMGASRSGTFGPQGALGPGGMRRPRRGGRTVSQMRGGGGPRPLTAEDRSVMFDVDGGRQGGGSAEEERRKSFGFAGGRDTSALAAQQRGMAEADRKGTKTEPYDVDPTQGGPTYGPGEKRPPPGDIRRRIHIQRGGGTPEQRAEMAQRGSVTMEGFEGRGLPLQVRQSRIPAQRSEEYHYRRSRPSISDIQGAGDRERFSDDARRRQDLRRGPTPATRPPEAGGFVPPPAMAPPANNQGAAASQIDLEGLGQQLNDTMGPVMAQFQGVNVDHNVNHQSLNVTGGDGIGQAIAQNVVEQVGGLIETMIGQAVGRISQDGTGKFKLGLG